MSAFWDGGRGEVCREKVFRRSRQNASVNRIGRIVKVYMNESRQTMNPNRNILGKYEVEQRNACVMNVDN